MFVAPYDTPAITRHMRLIWSCLGMSRDEIEVCLSQTSSGSNLLVDQSDIGWLRAQAPRHNLLRLGLTGVERLRPDGSVAETMALYEHCLPSQIVDHPTRSAIALDIVLDENTEEAWEQAETLIALGLRSQIAAAALIGTAQEIALRLNDYRKLGFYDVILTAPADRAPYRSAGEVLMPLLRQQAIPLESHARVAGISHGPFEWHGAAL
ncbi:hypothetical protein [Asaia prunellae]|uniref:hypothetical protein n=1 Tax=Asaia prunellae TaxID=610245 RepID=UPI00046FEE71|nr:hypothetical protein [Asaia prunellae]